MGTNYSILALSEKSGTTDQTIDLVFSLKCKVLDTGI
jgi:hypothetical protein